MSFDLQEELRDYPAPSFFKAGLIAYIEREKITVKSKRDLDKTVDIYKKLKIGE